MFPLPVRVPDGVVSLSLPYRMGATVFVYAVPARMRRNRSSTGLVPCPPACREASVAVSDAAFSVPSIWVMPMGRASTVMPSSVAPPSPVMARSCLVPSGCRVMADVSAAPVPVFRGVVALFRVPSVLSLPVACASVSFLPSPALASPDCWLSVSCVVALSWLACRSCACWLALLASSCVAVSLLVWVPSLPLLVVAPVWPLSPVVSFVSPPLPPVVPPVVPVLSGSGVVVPSGLMVNPFPVVVVPVLPSPPPLPLVVWDWVVAVPVPSVPVVVSSANAVPAVRPDANVAVAARIAAQRRRKNRRDLTPPPGSSGARKTTGTDSNGLGRQTSARRLPDSGTRSRTCARKCISRQVYIINSTIQPQEHHHE